MLPQILPLLNQPDADTNTVVDLIAYNQSLTGNVLRVCNSAYFSRGTPIDTLQHAVTRVGFRQIYDIVVSVISAVTLARPQKGYGVEANELWGHSVAAAVAAQIVARDCSADEQIVFTAAILHDIGKIVLSLALEDMKDKVAFETEKCNLSPYEIEMKLLGVNHAEIGGRLLEHWKLPAHLVAGVRYHHHPRRRQRERTIGRVCVPGEFHRVPHGPRIRKTFAGPQSARRDAGDSESYLGKYSAVHEPELRETRQVKHLYKLK